MQYAARHEATLDVVTATILVRPPSTQPAIVKVAAPATELHPAILALSAGLYATMIGIFWVTFASALDVAIALGIAAFFLAMFVAVPIVMLRSGTIGDRVPTTSLRAFLDGKLDTFTGLVSGRAALALVVTVPVCLTAGAAAMATIFRILQ